MKAIIHEMRNHLAVAVAVTEAFLDRKLEASDARLRGLLQTLRELDALIDDLPRDRTVEFETHSVPIDICRLIHNELAAMEGFALEHGVRLSLEACPVTHPECAQHLGDPTRIAEIVTNVLTNAIRYTPKGGAVAVECCRDRTSLRFSVADDGPGVADEERPKIFEPGFRGQAAAVASGSGIGLALVKQFVERQGGSVDVVNRPIRGATFTIKLPGAAGSPSCNGCEHHPLPAILPTAD